MSFFIFVTFVPSKKKTPSSTNGRLHGWTACAAAVKPATTRPAGVKLLWLCALYSRAAIAGAAITAFILLQNLRWFSRCGRNLCYLPPVRTSLVRPCYRRVLAVV